MGVLYVLVSQAERGSMGTAQELHGLSVCEMVLIGTLCAARTAWPFPLLAHRQVMPSQAGAVCPPLPSCCLSAWAKAG